MNVPVNVPIVAALLAAAILTAPPPPKQRLVGRSGAPAPRRVLRVSILTAAVVIALVGPPAMSGVAALAAATGWMRRRRTERRRRGRREGMAVAAALEVMVGELRVGAHPVDAFSAAAAESDGGVAVAFRTAAARARLGADVAAGLRAVGRHSAVPALWDRVAVGWQLADEHGLAMSGLMRAAHRDVSDRLGFADRVDAGLAGARTTAVTLASLPVLGVFLGQLIGADPVRFLLGDGAGGWLLVIGTALVCAGVTWADRIIEGLAS